MLFAVFTIVLLAAEMFFTRGATYTYQRNDSHYDYR